jgi:hypothetical protein
VFRDDPPPVCVLPGALDAVLALDRPGMLASGYVGHELTADGSLDIGPLQVQTRLLPHWLPNAGIRLTVGGRVLTYSGDTGPSHDVADLARGNEPWFPQPDCPSGLVQPRAATRQMRLESGRSAVRPPDRHSHQRKRTSGDCLCAVRYTRSLVARPSAASGRRNSRA